jgi:hypothetical protein
MIKTPQRWVIIEWTKDYNAFTKVLSSSDEESWELSHIIDRTEDRDDYLECTTRDGTTYKLSRGKQGMTTLTSKVYADISNKVLVQNDGVHVGVLAL